MPQWNSWSQFYNTFWELSMHGSLLFSLSSPPSVSPSLPHLLSHCLFLSLTHTHTLFLEKSSYNNFDEIPYSETDQLMLYWKSIIFPKGKAYLIVLTGDSWKGLSLNRFQYSSDDNISEELVEILWSSLVWVSTEVECAFYTGVELEENIRFLFHVRDFQHINQWS